MKMIEIDFRPDRRQLRQFGFIALVAFGLVGLLTWWKNGLFGFDFGGATQAVVGVFWALGLVSGLFALVAPRANWPLYVTLMVVTYPIGFVLSYVLMAVLFYGMFTPVGLIFRLIGRDSLNRRFEPEAKTYYARHRPAKSTERYFRQF